MHITGMTCAACSARVEKAARSVEGVNDVQVNLLTGILTYRAQDDRVSALITEAVNKAGYGVKDAADVPKISEKNAISEHVLPLVPSSSFSIKYFLSYLFINSFAFLSSLQKLHLY